MVKTFHYLLPPPDEVRDELPPDDVRLPPVEPELRGAGELDTAGRLLLPPDGVLLTAGEGVLRVEGVALRTPVLPELPERLSGRLYVALLEGLEYVEPEFEFPCEEVFPSRDGVTLLTW